MKAFASREHPEVTASYIDFSKPIDDKANVQANADPEHELLTFESHCYACSALGEVRMCQATIPFFKEIIIMAFSCEVCGHRACEVKQGGGISEKATKITFRVQKPSDINRDIFKSDTCVFEIPEVDLHLAPGTLGSVYTTVEGMMDKIITHLDDNNPFGHGDSATNQQFQVFLAKMEELKSGNKPFTIILDDPISNCFIYNPHAPEDDPQIEVLVYERTEEQNDELGISDMKC
jgi:zinc finger protein